MKVYKKIKRIILMVIAIIICVLGIYLLISGINERNEAKSIANSQYATEKAQYEIDKENWWNNPQEYSMPKIPESAGSRYFSTGIGKIFGGIFVIVISTIFFGVGVCIKNDIEFEKKRKEIMEKRENSLNKVIASRQSENKKTCYQCEYCGNVQEKSGKCDMCGGRVKRKEEK